MKKQATGTVLDDLPMQFVVDEQFLDEIVYVQSLPAKPGRQRKAPNPNTSRARQLREMKLLRQHIEDLKSQLQRAEEKHAASKANKSAWEGAAKQQRLEKQRAILENHKLRSQVNEYAVFIELMQASMHMKPRLTLNPTLASPTWQEYKLTAHAALRVAAIHAIADCQYRRLHSVMANAGLLEYTGEDFIRAFQRMDDNTLYRTLRLANATGEIHSNLVRKYYPEDDRDIVLWSSVLNDEHIPHMDHGAVNNESGW
ncbi:unnamed protein product [Aphanomyces euteiches]